MSYPDPTARTIEPRFHLERIYSRIFDKEGNEMPCVISYWLSENEIREVKVLIKDTDFSDFNYDVRVCVSRQHPNIDIIGEIERI